MLVLEGGAEFQGAMAEADLAAIAIAGGENINLCILPTAAAVDDNHLRAGSNGVRWFKALGVKNAKYIEVIDQQSANNTDNAKQLDEADLIFILGGSPAFLAQALIETACSKSLQHAYSKGKIVCGSSAGAMVLCQYYFNPLDQKIYRGLNMLTNTIFIPHHSKYGKIWLPIIGNELGNVKILGVDEETAIIGPNRSSTWQVYGKGRVYLYLQGKLTQNLTSGMILNL